MAFNLLALEINENIATYLDHDQDICSFSLICRTTWTAVNSQRCGLWRKLYAKRYDTPAEKLGIELKMRYKLRSKFLRKCVDPFQMGQSSKEIAIMDKLRDLVVESYSDIPMGRKASAASKNLEQLRHFVLRSNILDAVAATFYSGKDYNPILKTLQICLYHLQLDLSLRKATYGFCMSQRAVYGRPSDFPLFHDKDRLQVNIDLLLHTANFFKYHITRPEENTLYELFSQLGPNQKPRAWEGQLQQGRGIADVQRLGRHWKGSYAYLQASDMTFMRSLESREISQYIFTDHIDYHDGFQNLEIDFSRASNTVPWPKIFESHLHGLPTPNICRTLYSISKPVKDCSHSVIPQYHPLTTQPNINETGLISPPLTPTSSRRRSPRLSQANNPPPPTSMPKTPASPHIDPSKATKGLNYLQFSGTGTDAMRFACTGILHPLPPQHGIPGWQRVSLMKYFDPVSDHGHGIEGSLALNGGCWAYEGVVLPGGMMILGRWWSPMDDDERRECMGPFIFWNVADPDDGKGD